MFNWFKKKEAPEHILGVETNVVLGVSTLITVETYKAKYFFRYEDGKGLTKVVESPQHILEEISRRVELAKPYFKKCSELHLANAALEREVFKGHLTREEIQKQYAKIKHKTQKNKNAVKRIIEESSSNEKGKTVQYRNKSFKIRFLGHG